VEEKHEQRLSEAEMELRERVRGGGYGHDERLESGGS
jgi:hypothetical protein